MAAVGLVGDLCRSLTNQILPYCNSIIGILISNLSVSVLSGSVLQEVRTFSEISVKELSTGILGFMELGKLSNLPLHLVGTRLLVAIKFCDCDRTSCHNLLVM